MSGPRTAFAGDYLKLAKAEAVKQLLHPNGNIVGVGIGKKVKAGKETQEDCVKVYVVKKTTPHSLIWASLVPLHFLGVPTDVVEVGRLGSKGDHSKVCKATTPGCNLSRPGSPIRVRTDAPNVNQGARGTLGAVVTDGANKYILSCNHLLARNGRITGNDATVVSAEFVGTEVDLAKPGYFVKLDPDDANPADCAVALLPSNTDVQTAFPDDFKLSPGGSANPTPCMQVTKFGAITHRTRGSIVDTDVDLYVDYSFGTFRLEHQVMIDSGDWSEPFAAAGDSGSIAIDESTNRATAMIFAASGRFAVACPLDTVLTELAKKGPKLKIVSE